MKAGIIGCGNISSAYLNNGKVFESLSIVKCADLRMESARKQAERYQIQAVTVPELLEDPEIELILNLTTPQAHAEIDLLALEHGKHVYSEKPFDLSLESARKTLELARKNGLRTGCAPDTFLGGGHQQCRKLIDDGLIGHVVSGCAFMLCHGHESWHPAPDFYYQPGGGPLFDMGPYYITALVNMLGPVKSVAAYANRAVGERQGSKVNVNRSFPVAVDTHAAALLEFHSGAIVSLITSFDVWAHSGYRNIELYGTAGSLHVPDPNCFNGEIRYFQGGLSAGWAVADNHFIYNDNMRGIGAADMAAGIEHRRPHRCNGELAFHVLEIMCAITRSSLEKCYVEIESDCVRPAALSLGLKFGNLGD